MKTHNNSSSSLRRMSSSTSTLTCAVGAQGNAAATCAAADNNARTGCGTRRVLRLKGSTKGNTSGNSSSSSAAKGRAGTSNRITLKGSSSRRDAGPQQQHRQHQGAPAGATAGLGVKAVSLKKLAKTAELGSAPGAVTSKGTPGSKHAAPASIMPVQQPPATKACKDVSMSLLGDLDSSLSGGEALALDVQLTDDYWESIMQVGGGPGESGPDKAAAGRVHVVGSRGKTLAAL